MEKAGGVRYNMCMEKEGLLKKQIELTELLKKAACEYYSGDAETMSNLEYDKQYDALASLEAETGVVFSGSPTQRVGYEVGAELVKQAHAAPMLSLNKTKDAEDLMAWLGEQPGLLSYKMDGLTVALTYEGGVLANAVTRGNGAVGEVVTAGARTFLNLPVRIPFKGRLVLRGEAVITYSDFEAINREIEDVFTKYKNPRNLASGSVRQLDSSVTARRRVRFYAFALVEALSIAGDEKDSALFKAQESPPLASACEWKSRFEQMEFLGAQGFETVGYEPVMASGLEGAIMRFSEEASSSGFDLPVDGLVLEYDDIEYSKALGATSKYPRDAMAFKWQDEEAETELLSIEWSASRTGLINPIAIFAPIELERTTVSRASVHNVSILEEMELGKGDVIRIYKANMIIPQISENLTRSGTERPPETCPVCGMQTEIRETDRVKTLFCTNEECPARKIKAFTHFVSRPCLNIEGLSGQTLEKFIAAGLLHELADVFRLNERRDMIMNMEGFGEKSFDNLIAAVERARATTADRFLVSLGIPEIGAVTAKAISRSFGNDWGRIAAADAQALSKVEGVGAVIAAHFTEWFATPKNAAMAAAVVSEVRLAADPPAGPLASGSSPASRTPLGQTTFLPSEDEGLALSSSAGTNAAAAIDAPSSSAGTNAAAAETCAPLARKTFVITGSLDGYKSRDLLAEKIENLGGKVAASVSLKTDYLINNDPSSSSTKNKTAKTLGVPIITELEFEKLVEHDQKASQ